MIRPILLTGLFVVALTLPGSRTAAQDKFKSGPQVSELIPGSFSPFNINGKFGKKVELGDVVAGRHHCLVCEYDLNPVVLVFFRESKDDKTPRDDKLVTQLLGEIDQAIVKDKGFTGTLRGFAVFLSPFGTDSVIEAQLPEDKKTKDPEKLVELAQGRKELLKHLYKIDEDLKPKHVIITYYTDEGPKGYNLNPKAEITVLLYANFKVQANFAFQENQMTTQSIEEIMMAVDALVGKAKKADADAKPASK